MIEIKEKKRNDAKYGAFQWMRITTWHAISFPFPEQSLHNQIMQFDGTGWSDVIHKHFCSLTVNCHYLMMFFFVGLKIRFNELRVKETEQITSQPD